MGRFRDRMEQFMRGRYGTDQLNHAMTVFCLILLIAGIFVKSVLLSLFVWALLVFTLFRSFSRNYYKRRLENDRFMGVWNKIKSKFSLTVRRIKEIKAYRFRKCPHCKSVLRLPRKVGKHTVECPRCHKEFKMRVLF